MSAVEDIRAELARRVDSDHREGCRKYFQNTVDLWGVRSAELKAVETLFYPQIKTLDRKARYALFEELWLGRKLEEGAMVCHWARKFHREFGRTEFLIFEQWIDRHVGNWSHCDGVSAWLVAACLKNEPLLREKVVPWTRSRNRWKRRAAAVSFLQEAKRGRSIDFIFAVCGRLEDDTDLMVQKGIGWLLKETFPVRPEETAEFLELHAFSRLVVRYAREKAR